MARVCDRCKKELDTEKISNLADEKFELCLKCAEYISNHIKKHKPNKGMLGGMFNG